MVFLAGGVSQNMTPPDLLAKEEQMDDPKPINLLPDSHFQSQGWAAIARDSDGHAASVCSRENEDAFREWLAECVDQGLTVRRLTR